MMKDDTFFSQEESSNFLSPFAAFRTENNTKVKTKTMPTDEPPLFSSNLNSKSKQQNQNTSWIIGDNAPSDVSPIPFQNDDSVDLGDGNQHSYDDEDEESQHATAPYRQALHHSMLGENSFFSETSFLLGNDKSQQEQPRQPSNLNLNRSGIHPMWAPPPPSSSHNDYEENSHRKQQFLKGWNDGYANNINDNNNHGDTTITKFITQDHDSLPCAFVGKFVCTVSGCHFFAMAVHDFYLWYLSYRLGYPLHVSPWQALPWVSPSPTTLIQFGAFEAYKVVEDEQYWRFISSAFTCTSLVEWALVCFSWVILVQSSLAQQERYQEHHSSLDPYHSTTTTTHQGRRQFTNNNNNAKKSRGRTSSSLAWLALYLCCMLSGQLWMTACNPSGISGGASMGTCGVLFAAGATKSRYRYLIYLICISILMLQLLGTYTTIWGGLGACLTGWALYGLGWAVLILQPNGGDNYQQGAKTNHYRGNIKKDIITGELQTGTNSTSSQSLGSFRTKLLSGIILLALWVLPTLWVGYKFEAMSQYSDEEVQLE